MNRVSFGTYLRAAIGVGLIAGLLAGAHEGIRAALLQRHGAHHEVFSALADLTHLIGYPTTAYLAMFPLVLLVLTPLVFIAARIGKAGADKPRVYSLYAGLAAGGWVAVWQLFTLMPYISATSLLQGARLQAVGWSFLLGLLAGLAVWFLTHKLLQRMEGKRLGMHLLAAYPGLLFASVAAIWAVRNTSVFQPTPGRSALYWLMRALLVVAVDLVVALLLWFILYRIYRALSKPGLPSIARICLYALTPLALMGATFLTGAASEAEPIVEMSESRVASGRNFLLVSIDTIRADSMSCYGYERETSPHMDQLAREGALFEHVTAQSSWTLSSLASLVTSTFPGVHGIYTGSNRLDHNRTTLAEILSNHGYNTSAVLSNGWLQPPFGMNQGFSYYYCTGEGIGDSELIGMIWSRILRRLVPGYGKTSQELMSAAPDITQKAMEWLEANKDSNFFLWVHYIDPHDPYAPPPDYLSLWNDGTYKGPYAQSSGSMVSVRGGRRLSKADRDHMKLLYDQEIRATDHSIGQLLQKLYELGLKENTLIVVAGDHGEEFWEHEGTMHGGTTYAEVVFTPLIFTFPGVIEPGTRVDIPVSNLDIAPTVLDLLEVACSEDCGEFQGRNLKRELLEPDYTPEEPRYQFTEAMIYFTEKKAVTDGRYRFVYTPASERKELYDTLEDPLEQDNLVAARPEIAAMFEDVLFKQMAENQKIFESIPKAGEAELGVNPELVDQLRAMGYLQ